MRVKKGDAHLLLENFLIIQAPDLITINKLKFSALAICKQNKESKMHFAHSREIFAELLLCIIIHYYNLGGMNSVLKIEHFIFISTPPPPTTLWESVPSWCQFSLSAVLLSQFVHNSFGYLPTCSTDTIELILLILNLFHSPFIIP